MKVLRTPDERFRDLPGYPFAPHYFDVPDGEGGSLRVHYLDRRPRGSGRRAPDAWGALMVISLPQDGPHHGCRRIPGSGP